MGQTTTLQRSVFLVLVQYLLKVLIRTRAQTAQSLNRSEWACISRQSNHSICSGKDDGAAQVDRRSQAHQCHLQAVLHGGTLSGENRLSGSTRRVVCKGRVN